MGTYNDVNPTPLDMSGWSTVFFDGFNGTQLDWTKWPITYGGSMYWNNAFWWDNGQLSTETNFDGGKRHGLNRYWNLQGQLIKEQVYEHDVSVSEKHFDPK
jgi:antitoxin component YwqK of YwqJK toxin-antitoxin module